MCVWSVRSQQTFFKVNWVVLFLHSDSMMQSHHPITCRWGFPECANMMTSSKGNISCVTGPLWGESPVDSPHKGQWCGTLLISLICAWTNGWANNRDASDLKHHHADYDVIVMNRPMPSACRQMRSINRTGPLLELSARGCQFRDWWSFKSLHVEYSLYHTELTTHKQ